MSWKPTLWLLVMVILTGIFIVVFDNGVEPAAGSLPLDSPLLHASADSITRLGISSPGCSCECVKREGQWVLVKPYEMRADSAKVNRLVSALLSLRKQEVIDPDRREKRNLTFASFGLESPQARFVVGSELRADEILVGDRSPLGDRLFVRLNGSLDVMGVSGRYPEVLSVTSDELQDRGVFPPAVKEAVRLEMKHPGGFFQLVLRDGVWRIQQPFDALADGARVERLLQSLASLGIAGFNGSASEGDSAAYGLEGDEAGLQVTVWRAGGREPFVLTVGKARQDNPSLLYARISDAGRVFSISNDVLALQNLKAESLRDRRLCNADPARIMSVSLRDGDLKLVMERTPVSGWMITEPIRFAGNARAIGTLLRKINGLQGDELKVAGTNRIPVEAERLTCRLVLASHAVSVATNEPTGALSVQSTWSYRLSPPGSTPGACLVYAEESGKLFRADPDRVAQLWTTLSNLEHPVFADPLPYMECRMLDLNPKQVRRITLARQGREETVTLDAESVWTVESPPEGLVAEGAVPALLELASDLQSERVESVSVTNAAPFGLGESATRVTFGLSGGGIQKTILVGSDNGQGGVFAMIQGQDAMFVLKKSVADALMRPLVKLP